jgi:hypothetical protein
VIEKQIERVNEELKKQRKLLKNMNDKTVCDAIWLRNQDLIPEFKVKIKSLERERAKLRYRLKKLKKKKVKVVLI